MSHGSRVCASCGALNAGQDARCVRCGASLGGFSQAIASMVDSPHLATRVLLGLCLINFALVSLDHGGLALGFLGPNLLPSEVLRWGATYGGLALQEPWRYLSAVYVHLGALHLAMNSMALVALSRRAEQRVGGARTVVVFTLTGVAGFVASQWWYGSHGPLTAGASGALFGLMGHEIGQMHARRDPQLKDVLVQFLAYAVAFALLFSVNNAAHIGGFLLGYPCGRLFFLERRPWRRAWLFRGLAVIAVAAGALSVALSSMSDEWQRLRAQEIQYGLR
jgi:membrane associated rhomboid family serine protease